MKDNRNILLILLILSFLLSILTIFVVAEGGVPTVSARTAAVFEPQTGTFVYEKDSNKRLPMASTTKIMTALLAIELLDLDQSVVIPAEATGIEGSSVYLKAGDEITVRDLVYSVLLQSANDASTALAILISGDVASFASLMNETARQIGLTDTNYENPHGLDSGEHYTTAHDLALLASVALKNEAFEKITSTYKHTFAISETLRTVVNHNKLLKRYKGCIGVKTGYTDKSGRCLVSAAERDGVQLIAVTMNASDDWNDHTKMLDYGFSLFEAIPLYTVSECNFSVSVIDGEKERVSASVKKDAELLVHLKSSAPLRATQNIVQSVEAPVSTGDIIGSITVYQGDKAIYTFPITADEDVNKKKKTTNFFDILEELF